MVLVWLKTSEQTPLLWELGTPSVVCHGAIGCFAHQSSDRGWPNILMDWNRYSKDAELMDKPESLLHEHATKRSSMFFMFPIMETPSVAHLRFSKNSAILGLEVG